MSALWRTTRTATALLRSHSPLQPRRNFHKSLSLLKKRSGKQASAVVHDDPFAESLFEEEDLFASKEPESTTQAVEKDAPASAQRSSQDPAALFDSKYTFLQQYILKPPPPQIRDNSLDFLLLYVRTNAQLTQFVEFLPRWRESGRVVHQKTALDLIDRCVKRNPALLIDVFENRRIYGIDIPNLAQARRILHAIVNFMPLSEVDSQAVPNVLRDAARLAALYPTFNLPPATQDLTSLALLAQACAQDADSTVGGEALSALLPTLAVMLQRPGPSPPQGVYERIGKGDDPNSVAERRHAGLTQTSVVEWKWVTTSLQILKDEIDKMELKGEYVRVLEGTLRARMESVSMAQLP